jgi:hypothetical protein
MALFVGLEPPIGRLSCRVLPNMRCSWQFPAHRNITQEDVQKDC